MAETLIPDNGDEPQSPLSPSLLDTTAAGLEDPSVQEKLGAESIALLKRVIAEMRGRQAVANIIDADSAELSPERERALGLLLARYDENLDKGLYTAESAPKAEVEKWLRQDLTRLDTAARWEARGGKPMFTGEEDGEFCMDECSAEVPNGIRNICYGPNAAKQEGLSEDRNALTQAEKLGGTLLTKTRRAKLFAAGLIKDSGSSEWLLDPENRDLVMQGDKVKDYGLAWRAGCGVVAQSDAFNHVDRGGLRCSLRGPKL